jgi:hypothetical protein
MDTTLRTIDSIMQSESDIQFKYTIYNDLSTDENTAVLESESKKYGFDLINIKDITDHPSPNYLLVLKTAREKAINDNAHLLLIESDVIVEKNTIQKMFDYCSELEKVGMIAAVTIDEDKRINYPYNYAEKYKYGVVKTKKVFSFCCTLLTIDYLKRFDFNELKPDKWWFDVPITHKSTELGFNNYLLTSLPVYHFPHSSRPWKRLKYSNPIKYYWKKTFHKLDKI